MKRLLSILFFVVPLLLSAQLGVNQSGRYSELPTAFDSLLYWFAADQSVLDSAGSSIEDWEGVGTWEDLSGNNYDMTQITAGQYPQYRVSAGPNGTPAIYFDGINDYLASSSHWWGSDQISIFAVIAFTDSGRDASEIVISHGDASGSNRQWVFFGAPDVQLNKLIFRTFPDGGTVNWEGYNASVRSESYKIHTFVSDGSGEVTIHEDSEPKEVITITTGAGDGSINGYTDPISVGANNVSSTPASFLDGYISELIVFSRNIPPDERLAIETYLSNKYRLKLQVKKEKIPIVRSVSPDLIPDLELWLDAGIGVAESGGSVSGWDDQSGNSRDFTQGVAGNKPTLVSGVLNGKPIVRFTTDDWMSYAGTVLAQDDETFTYIFVLKATDGVSFYRMFGQYTGTDNSLNQVVRTDGQERFAVDQYLPSGSLGQSTTGHTNFSISSVTLDGTNVLFQYNGSDDGQHVIETYAGGVPTLTVLGADDNNGTKGNFFEGDIAELLVYSRTLTKPEGNEVVEYLRLKYDIWDGY